MFDPSINIASTVFNMLCIMFFEGRVQDLLLRI